MVDIYSNGKPVRKSKGYEAMIHRAPNTLTMRDRNEAARRRRVMAQGLSDSALRQYEKAIIEHAKKFCDCIGTDNERELMYMCDCEKWSPARNMANWCSFLTHLYSLTSSTNVGGRQLPCVRHDGRHRLHTQVQPARKSQVSLRVWRH